MLRGGWRIPRDEGDFEESFTPPSPAGCEWKRALRAMSSEHPFDEGRLSATLEEEDEAERRRDVPLAASRKKVVLREALVHFQKQFGSIDINTLKAGISPGRVNLIGDHVDYVNGFVLPIAVPLYTIALGGEAEPGREYTRVFSTHFNEFVNLYHKTSEGKNDQVPKWAHYIEGVFALHPPNVPLNIILHSHLPVGSGLSSSAAVELAAYQLFDQYTTTHLSVEKAALLCQRAEHEFAGVPCGIMDQFVCALAHPGRALKIDCSNLAYDRIPLEISPDAMFIIVDTGVRHSLAGSEYAKRRATVEAALKKIGASSWRDVNETKLREHFAELSEVERDCSLHIVGEIARTEEAAAALLDNNIRRFGNLMWDSHKSLRDLYKVSCDELDTIVEISRNIPGVFGARMTGGGFGGCVVALVKSSSVEEYKKAVKEKYSGTPNFFDGIPVGGAGLVDASFFGESAYN